MYYSDELVEEVRSRSDIVAVIGTRVKLTKKGANYFGCCPFHSEKTPSFSVSPARQIYHCFGCGAGGNVISFLMNYENYSFPEALEQLAERAGIALPRREMSDEEKKQESLRTRLLGMNGEAAKFFYYLLRQNAGLKGMTYFTGRGLKPETLQKFGLGFAPEQWDALYKFLKSRGYDDREIKAGALVKFREDRGPMDFFRGRVMFPIMDRNSRVIGFGGRVLDGSEPKYLNSNETPLFDKGRNLYGLHLARATRRPYYLLTEGYMDVIALHQAGIDCAVASLGTALTGGHAMLLKRYTDTVILTYDSDGAGVKAAMRAIPLLREAGLGIRVLNMQPWKDPDEFISHEGAEAFEERIAQAENFFLYQSDVWKKGFNLQNPAERTAFHKKLAEELTAFTDELERENYLAAVCARHGIDVSLLRGLTNRIGNRKQMASPGYDIEKDEELPPEVRNSPLKKEKDEGVLAAQQILLCWAAASDTAAERLGSLLKEEDFPTELYREILRDILWEKREKGRVVPAAILSRYLEDEEKSRLAAAVFSRGFSENIPAADRARVLSENLRRLRKDRLNRALREETNPAGIMALTREIRAAGGLVISENEV